MVCQIYFHQHFALRIGICDEICATYFMPIPMKSLKGNHISGTSSPFKFVFNASSASILLEKIIDSVFLTQKYTVHDNVQNIHK